MINPLVEELAAHTDVKTVCALLGRPRGSHYRAKAPRPVPEPAPRPTPPNKLTDDERRHVLEVLTSERFADKSVAQTWATLLDEGTYLCRSRRCTGSCGTTMLPASVAVRPPTRRGNDRS